MLTGVQPKFLEKLYNPTCHSYHLYIFFVIVRCELQDIKLDAFFSSYFNFESLFKF